jgi:hypothetical protein
MEMDYATELFPITAFPTIFSILKYRRFLLILQWVKPEDPLILMAVPSYIGCSASALCCMFSALMLIYLR